MRDDWLDTFIDDALDMREESPDGAAPTEFSEFAPGREALVALRDVLLGYSPVIDRSAGVFATRLTVVPTRSGPPPHAGALLAALSAVWGDEGAVLLNIGSETLLHDLLRAQPAANIVIEVPAFMAADPAQTQTLQHLASRGNALLLKGRPVTPLPGGALPCFKWSIVDLADDRRTVEVPAHAAAKRRIPHIQSGVDTVADLRRSFALGAMAVIGWPLHAPSNGGLQASPDARVVLDALNSIERGDSAEKTHHLVMRDPVLAYELMCHANADVDLAVETRSMHHAVALIGAAGLRRWLSEALGRSSHEGGLRPANFAALRRGLLMRMLAPAAGLPDARGELFMCGVLSLLDRIYARPIGDLLQRLALPEAVRSALVERTGPYAPLLELARSIESAVAHDIHAAADAVFIAPLEINLALLRSLLVASRLERPKLPRGAEQPDTRQ